MTPVDNGVFPSPLRRHNQMQRKTTMHSRFHYSERYSRRSVASRRVGFVVYIGQILEQYLGIADLDVLTSSGVIDESS